MFSIIHSTSMWVAPLGLPLYLALETLKGVKIKVGGELFRQRQQHMQATGGDKMGSYLGTWDLCVLVKTTSAGRLGKGAVAREAWEKGMEQRRETSMKGSGFSRWWQGVPEITETGNFMCGEWSRGRQSPYVAAVSTQAMTNQLEMRAGIPYLMDITLVVHFWGLLHPFNWFCGFYPQNVSQTCHLVQGH